MASNFLIIEERVRKASLYPVSLSDFRYSEGPSVDAGVVLRNPMLSLYSLDHARRRAIFVESLASPDLSAAPFYYQAQYLHAQRLLAVPYDEIDRMAAELEVASDRLIVVYSTGRCGSTLVSRVLGSAPKVVSLSEPDVFTHLASLRDHFGSNDAEVLPLLRSCTKLLYATSIRDPGDRLAIKGRGTVIGIADLMKQAFPDARLVFLYRHAEHWLESVNRKLYRDLESKLTPSHLQAFPFLNDERWFRTTPPFSSLELWAYFWISAVEMAQRLQDLGAPIFMCRYEDIQSQPLAVVEALSRHCGLDTGVGIEAILSKDAQAGTSVSRAPKQDGQLEEWPRKYADEMRRLLELHAKMAPDFVIPGTLRLETSNERA